MIKEIKIISHGFRDLVIDFDNQNLESKILKFTKIPM